MFRLFAELLEYPSPRVVETARACEALAGDNPEAAALIGEFRAFLEQTPAERVEEIYSATFDLNATCYPYVGYHLFGESYKRSVFMLELKKRYQELGLEIGNELPDHLAALLRFTAVQSDLNATAEIVHEALVPALDRMTGRARSAGYEEDESPKPDEDATRNHPYRPLLEALRLVLQRVPASGETSSTEAAQHPLSAAQS